MAVFLLEEQEFYKMVYEKSQFVLWLFLCDCFVRVVMKE